MNLRSIVTPALTCFILVLCIAIFAAVSQKSLKNSDNPQADTFVETTTSPTTEIKPVRNAVATPTPPPTSRVVPKPKPTTKPAVSNRCIVTVQGKRYDVTTLRKTHSGGDIFSCGKDMTTIFTSQHGTNFSMLRQYLIG